MVKTDSNLRGFVVVIDKFDQKVQKGQKGSRRSKKVLKRSKKGIIQFLFDLA